MSPLISELLIAGWGLVVFAALVALLEWKHRRNHVARRMARGLRSYTAARPQAVSE